MKQKPMEATYSKFIYLKNWRWSKSSNVVFVSHFPLSRVHSDDIGDWRWRICKKQHNYFYEFYTNKWKFTDLNTTKKHHNLNIIKINGIIMQ